MTIEELRQKVFQDLDSRGLKNPSIRKGALNNILSFIETQKIYSNNGDLSLPSDKNSFKLSYQKWKGKELNSAESSVINTMYEHYNGKVLSEPEFNNKNTQNINKDSVKTTKTENSFDIKDIEKKLLQGSFRTVNELAEGNKVPDDSGLYCIKLRKGIVFSKDYGKIREDGIIYIGKAESSLRKRLWDQELNHNGHATFFRSIGAMLGKTPPKGSLYGKKSRNYEFDQTDTEFIKKWMRQSLLVNFISIPKDKIKKAEDKLIKKYCPLVNIKGNPQKSKAIEDVREECVKIAKSKP